MYLSITNVSKSYGVHPVLNQVSLVLNAGQRIGLEQRSSTQSALAKAG
jgi:ATPase subunit of ABC transporter with duplicated ATPase domains